MKFIILLFPILLLAEISICKGHYYNDFIPNNNEKLHELCYEGFAVNYADSRKNPYWVASSITDKDIIGAKEITRHCTFTPELRLDISVRASDQDFTNSGHSRGHMYANGYAPTEKLQQESCILTNIVPQKQKGNNGGIWKQFEESTQQLALKEGLVYEISGPLFIGKINKITKHNVSIPTKLFKMVYSPKQKKAIVLVIDNIDNAQQTLKQYSIITFETKYGIKLMDKNYPLLKFKY